MANYIDSEAFIENERRTYCVACERRMGVRNGKAGMIYEIGDAPCRACWVDDMLGDVEDFPSSEVAEVKHARWEQHYGDPWDVHCSNCDFAVPNTVVRPNYCENCGAQMDESEDEEDG